MQTYSTVTFADKFNSLKYHWFKVDSSGRVQYRQYIGRVPQGKSMCRHTPYKEEYLQSWVKEVGWSYRHFGTLQLSVSVENSS